MYLSLEEALSYLEAEKEIVANGSWQSRENRDNRCPIRFFESRVKIANTLPRGLKFRISVFPTFPNVATFQLECDQPRTKTCITLYRLDWRPLSAHGNGMHAHVPEEFKWYDFPSRRNARAYMHGQRINGSSQNHQTGRSRCAPHCSRFCQL